MTDTGRFHHVTLAVTDLDRSVAWYTEVLGMERVADRQGPGWTRALMRTDDGLTIGLTMHEDTPSTDRFDHRRVGMDHLSIACAGPATIEAWRERLDEAGAAHGPIEHVSYGVVLTARDPDDIPIEFFAPMIDPVQGGR
jgi:glyoxylase I family protein